MLRRLTLVLMAFGLCVATTSYAAVPSASAGRRVAGTVVAGAADCGGAKFDKVLVGSPHIPYYCVHHARDTYDAMAIARGVAAGVPAVGVKPRCYGDGQTGPRVQMIYGYAQGDPDRSKVAVPQIANNIAWKMAAIVRAASAGQDLDIRFAMTPGCGAVDVKTIAFPRDTLYNDKPGSDTEQYGRIAAYLDEIGLNRTDRKYDVIWDGWVSGGTCGLGALLQVDTPQPANINDGGPTVGGYTDGAGAGRNAINSVSPVKGSVTVPQLDVVWNHVFRKGGPSCWGTGTYEWPIAALHEMMHSVGAVQQSAPHSDGGAHCLDVPSVMCYGAHVVYFPQCDHKPVPVLDCGQDDYWNPNPAPQNYLFSHNNLAKAPYFGPQPQDNVTKLPVKSPV